MKGNDISRIITDMVDNRQRNKLWAWVRGKKVEYDNLPAIEVDYDFWRYLDVNYGVVPVRDQEGHITSDYKITDKEKFFMTKLSGLDI